MSDENAELGEAIPKNWEERRSTPRHKTNIEISWRLLSEKPQQVREGDLVDLSISGAAVCVDYDLPMGSTISIKLPAPRHEPESAHPRPSTSLSVKGTVVNSRAANGGLWRYGIKFDRLYYTLAQWVNQAAAK